MHPYRTAPPDDHAPAGAPLEEWLVGWALLAVGVARVAIAIAAGGRFDTEATIAAIVLAIGAGMLVRCWRAG